MSVSRGFRLPIMPLTLVLALIVSVVGVAVSKDYAFENEPPRANHRSNKPIDKRSSCYFTYLNLPIEHAMTFSRAPGVAKVHQNKDYTIEIDFSIGTKFRYKPKSGTDLMYIAVQSSFDSTWKDSVYVLQDVRQYWNVNGEGYSDYFFIFPNDKMVLYAFDFEKPGSQNYGFDQYCIDRSKKQLAIHWVNSEGDPDFVSKIKLNSIPINSGKGKSQKGKRKYNLNGSHGPKS